MLQRLEAILEEEVLGQWPAGHGFQLDRVNKPSYPDGEHRYSGLLHQAGFLKDPIPFHVAGPVGDEEADMHVAGAAALEDGGPHQAQASGEIRFFLPDVGDKDNGLERGRPVYGFGAAATMDGWMARLPVRDAMIA